MRHSSSSARSASGALRRRPAASTTVQCVVAKMSPGALAAVLECLEVKEVWYSVGVRARSLARAAELQNPPGPAHDTQGTASHACPTEHAGLGT